MTCTHRIRLYLEGFDRLFHRQLTDLTDSRDIHHQIVRGLDIGSRSECRHWHSPLDIVAIKFPCCDTYFACYECHRALADHEPAIRGPERLGELCILCGACGQELTVDEYVGCGSQCPRCEAAFNPGCVNHYPLYFALNDP